MRFAASAGGERCSAWWTPRADAAASRITRTRNPVVTGSVLLIDAASPRGAIPACVLVEHAGSRSVRCTPTNKGHHITGLTGNIVDMAVGDDHVCVLRAGNQVQCVGDNLFGRVTGRSLFNATDWP